MEIQIVEAVEILSADPTRMGKKDAWITYTVDGIRTYQLILPSEEVTEAKITEAIKKAETERAKLIGKKFTV